MRALFAMAVMATLAVGAMAQTPVELKVGDTAPDFTLQGTDGKTHKLSDYRGKRAVVLAWFPKAFTQGCTIECKSLAANGDRIRKFDVAYFMASVDPLEGEGGNMAFAKSESADFPLLSDPTKETATKYGVLNARGLANRWTFYIDKNGKTTSAEDMIAKMGELKVATQ
jgi:thioredoxin-dependent peroxiredoxin